MSKVVDERIVEMRFDNKQFESNVSQSMSTLQKLKQSLNLKGASQGLNDLNIAAKRVDMSPLGRGVEAVGMKFSAMQIMATTALVNITNQAVNAGKRIVSALTIDPVRSGFKEYETQINAVQTILANTQKEGATIERVNAALDELNAYADLTIYNFTEMTRNIGTFTAAGVDLDTSVNAIQGIANLAAVSGSTSQQASVAMYQLSQALSSGTVRLMDWNSVVNAGMGGQVFQDALKETSKLLGTGAEAAIAAEGSFRESLNTGWLTAEVLTETLKKFTTSGANEYVAEYTGLSVEAVKAALDEAEARYGEADAIEKASEALAEKSGKNKEEIKSALQFAKTAEDAATKVKTLTQLWDALKEAAQSGWAQTWRLIVGDFEEAKSLYKPLFDFLSGIINKMSEARNTLLASALGKGFKDLASKFNAVLEPVEKTAESMNKVTASITDLGSVVDDVIIGKFGNGQERFDALTKAGYNWCEVQNKVNEKLGSSYRYAVDQATANKKLSDSQTKVSGTTEEEANATVKLTDEQKKQIKELVRAYEEKDKDVKLTEDQIAAIEELTSVSKKLGIPMNDLIDNLDKINGRWLLINSFKNIGMSIVKVFTSIGNALKKVFKPLSSNKLFNAIAAFHKFSTTLIISDSTAKKITDTFKGLFSIIKLLATIAGGTLKLAFVVVNRVLSSMGLTFLDVTAAIGNAVTNIVNFIQNSKFIKGIYEGIANVVEKVADAVSNFIRSLTDNTVFKELSEVFSNLFSETGDETGIVSSIEKITKAMNISEESANTFKSVIQGVLSGFDLTWSVASASFLGFLKILDAIFKLLGTNIGDALNWIADKITEIAKFVEEDTIFGSNTKYEDLAKIIVAVYDGISSCVSEFKKLKPLQKLITKIKDAITELFNKLDFSGLSKDFLSVEKVVSKIGTFFSNIKTWISGLSDSEHLGFDIIAGIFNGIKDNAPKVVKAIIDTAISIIEAFCEILGIHSPSKKFWEYARDIILGLVNGIRDFMELILTAMGKLGNKILESFRKIKIPDKFVEIIKKLIEDVKLVFNNLLDFIKSIKIENILALIPVGVSLFIVKGFYNIIKTFQNGIKGINGVLNSVSFLFKKLGKSAEMLAKAKAAKDFAIAIAILVGSIVVLSYAIKYNEDNLGAAVGIVLLLALVIGGLAAAIGFLNKSAISISKTKGIDLSGVNTMVIQIGATMALIAWAVKSLGSMNQEQLTQGMQAMGEIIVELLILLGLIRLFSMGKDMNPESIDSLGRLAFKLGITMLILVGVCKLAGKLEEGDLYKGAGFLAVFALFVGSLALVADNLKSDEKKLKEFRKLVSSVTWSILLMAIICGLIGLVAKDDGVFGKGIDFCTTFLVFIYALCAITDKFDNATAVKIRALGKSLPSIVFAIGMMVVVSLIAEHLTLKGAAFGAVFCFVFLGFLKALAKVSASSDKIGPQLPGLGKTLISVAFLMTVMAVICTLCSLLSLPMLGKGLACVIVFGGLVSLMIGLTKNTTDVSKNIMMMAVSIAIMVGALLILSLIPKSERLLVAAISMGIVMAMFALIESQSKNVSGAYKTILTMGVVILAIAGAIWIVAQVPWKQALAGAGAMAIVLITMAGSMALIGKFGEMSNRAMASVAIMVGALFVLTKVISIVAGIDNTVGSAINAAIAIGILAVTLGASMALLGNVAENSVTLPSILKMAAMIGVIIIAIYALTHALKMLKGIDATSCAIGLGALAATILIFAVAAQALVGAEIALLALGGALLMLGAAIYLVGAGIDSFAQGMLMLSLMTTEAANRVVENIGTLVIGILELIPSIASALLEAIKSICATILGAAPEIAEVVGTLILNVLKNIVQKKAEFLDQIVQLITGCLDGLTSKLPQVLDSLANFIVNLLNGLTAHMPAIVEAVTNFIGSVVDGVVANLGSIIDRIIVPLLGAVGDIISKLVEAIGPYIPTICSSIETVTQTICDAIVAVVEALAPYMPNLESMVLAICNSFNTLITNIAPVINSISNLIRQLGDTITQILGGISTTVSTIGDAICEVFNSLSDTISTACSGITEVLGGLSDVFDSAFGGVSDVIDSVGGAIEGFLEGIADIIDSVGEAALNCGTGFDKLANGIVKITNTKLSDMSSSLAAVATGLGDIAVHSDGMDKAGDGFKNIADSIKSSSSSLTLFNTLITGIKLGLSSLTTYLSTAGTTFTKFGSSITTAINGGLLSGTSQILTTVSNLVNSISTAMVVNTIVFRVAGVAMITGLNMGISSGIPQVISTIVSLLTTISAAMVVNTMLFVIMGRSMMMALNMGLTSGSSQALSTVTSLMTQISMTIIAKQGILLGAGLGLMSGLQNGISAGGSNVITVLSLIVSRMAITVMSRTAVFIAAGYAMMAGFANSLRAGIPLALVILTSMLTVMTIFIKSRVGVFKLSGVNLINALITGIKSRRAQVMVAAKSVLSGAVTSIRTYYSNFKEAGKYLGDGLIYGMQLKSNAVYWKGYELGKAAAKGVKAGAQEKSPSKLTKQYGIYIGEGLIVGMSETFGAVYRTGKEMGESAATSIFGALNGISDAANLDYEPTIRPVVDLNDLQNGGKSIQIGADISSRLLSEPVNTLQNIISNAQANIDASNAKVINAINGLRNDLNAFYEADDKEIALYMDSRKVASTIAKPMNRELNILAKRGAY